MQLLVQSTCITHGQSIAISPPQRRRIRGAVGAGDSRLLNSRQAPLVGLDQRPIVAVHLVIQTASVAQIIPSRITTPQRRVSSMAVDALPSVRNYLFRLAVLRRPLVRLQVVLEQVSGQAVIARCHWRDTGRVVLVN